MNNLMSNYRWGLPIQASTYAARIDHSLAILHAVMFLVFGLWAVYMVYCLFRYRGSNGGRALYSHHTPLSSYIPDLLMLTFEIWLIFVIGLPLWAHIREDLPKSGEATEVHIMAQQFAWIIHYPGPDGKFGKQDPALVNFNNPLGLDASDPAAKDDVVSVNELHAPLDKPILIHLTAEDVIHSFFIPEFRIKQDAVPGMNIPIWVKPSRAGQYEIACAQLCGTGHYRMRGDVYVTSPEEFQAWLSSQPAAVK